MALNYSQRPLFPALVSEDNLVSPMRIVNGYCIEGVPEKNREGYARPWRASQGVTDDWHFNCGRDRVDCYCSKESNSKDIVDLLPSDPFGMDIKTTFTAISGWLEDLEVEYGGYVKRDTGKTSQDNYGLFAGWNLIWNNSLKFQSFPSNFQFNEKLNNGFQSFPSNTQVYQKPDVGVHSLPSCVQGNEKLDVAGNVDQIGEEKDIGDALAPYEFGFQLACNRRDNVGYNNESTCCSSEQQCCEKVEDATESDSVPHEALILALSYLGVNDLLSVERVCRSLCSTVQGDPLLWMSIHIDQPLNERITDALLLQLALRAQGHLQCLSLVECPKITDDGVRRILEINPRLTKLCVPGCTRLTIEGILNSIKVHNSKKDVPGIKLLRIGGLYGVTYEHFEELKLLLGTERHRKGSYHKPHFYHRGNFYLPYDDDRTIDIEMCPRCEKFRLIYDCPAEGCQVTDKTSLLCRACTLCIARCAQCGRCINDNEYEETFCLELLCSDCFKQPLNYQHRLDKKIDPHGALREPSYHFSHHA
ncbi:F-box protein SKIP14-like [Sesamum indicum]|uniref:F-box protein SKIP14-like n=1 Tax=Sesamum indicum TaxID=4182 RepID=A0A6I9SPS3_SESIN|nr:F-box protein SKIP14-like [Sesamum indicum]